MNRNVIRAALGGGVLYACILPFLAVPILAESPQVDNSWEKNSYQWFEKVPPGGRVRVDNPFGNIYARFGGYEHELEILATIQRIDKTLPELEVRRSVSESGLDVIVRPVPAKNAGDGPAASPPETRDRVDLVIFVPLESVLDARTVDGRIEVKGIKGDLVADSVKGDLWIRGVEGSVRARTERGRVTATLETDVTAEPQEISTVTGEIEVHLWEDVDMNVEISTSGVISTDFSIDIEHRRFEEPGKHATARVGKGGPGLVLSSKRGPIRLLRLPRHFKSDEQEEQNP